MSEWLRFFTNFLNDRIRSGDSLAESIKWTHIACGTFKSSIRHQVIALVLFLSNWALVDRRQPPISSCLQESKRKKLIPIWIIIQTLVWRSFACDTGTESLVRSKFTFLDKSATRSRSHLRFALRTEFRSESISATTTTTSTTSVDSLPVCKYRYAEYHREKETPHFILNIISRFYRVILFFSFRFCLSHIHTHASASHCTSFEYSRHSNDNTCCI